MWVKLVGTRSKDQIDTDSGRAATVANQPVSRDDLASSNFHRSPYLACAVRRVLHSAPPVEQPMAPDLATHTRVDFPGLNEQDGRGHWLYRGALCLEARG